MTGHFDITEYKQSDNTLISNISQGLIPLNGSISTKQYAMSTCIHPPKILIDQNKKQLGIKHTNHFIYKQYFIFTVVHPIQPHTKLTKK